MGALVKTTSSRSTRLSRKGTWQLHGLFQRTSLSPMRSPSGVHAQNAQPAQERRLTDRT
jgi:hypothetical protein